MLKFKFCNDGTWYCTRTGGYYQIEVCSDGSFNASYTDNKAETKVNQKETEIVFTLRQSIEWCERYETKLRRDSGEK